MKRLTKISERQVLTAFGIARDERIKAQWVAYARGQATTLPTHERSTGGTMSDQPREEQIAVRTYGIRYWCTREGCGGVLKYTGTALLTNPMQHVHLCIACGKRYDTPKVDGSTATEFVQ